MVTRNELTKSGSSLQPKKKVRLHGLFSLATRQFLWLQETNLAPEVYDLKRKLGVHGFFSLATRQFHGTLILILEKDLLHKHFFHQGHCGRIQALDLKVKCANIRVVNIYTPPAKESEQNQFYENLKA